MASFNTVTTPFTTDRLCPIGTHTAIFGPLACGKTFLLDNRIPTYYDRSDELLEEYQWCGMDRTLLTNTDTCVILQHYVMMDHDWGGKDEDVVDS